ncbi:tetratricopeptide repeat-containing protein [Roseovarius sp. M141]|uniref:tetratricopeptide repeat-containing protein n=1 Tax=Roseovarius sp. M141 TaxID=2583806 RepID=UPI0020CD6C56|nr:tetratricopeptide repeat-containing protein [Roseovarius sp. M141]MCQ0094142.1 tetratricopeptide repeat-containing protein [Roseovarius sp. M141]
MSYTITKPYVPRIWAFKRSDPDWQLAQNSGWTRADLMWERLMEAGNEAFCAGQMPRAGRLFFCADALARGRFDAADLRRATAPAARAMVRMAQGKDAGALIALARQGWQVAPVAVADMDIRPRIRSSLFHLRLEAKHRGQYQDNLRLRLGRITEETRETLAQMDGDGTRHRHFARWRGEKPTVFDGTRKVLAAALLIPDAPPR